MRLHVNLALCKTSYDRYTQKISKQSLRREAPPKFALFALKSSTNDIKILKLFGVRIPHCDLELFTLFTLYLLARKGINKVVRYLGRMPYFDNVSHLEKKAFCSSGVH
jgi:hypothetical protein